MTSQEIVNRAEVNAGYAQGYQDAAMTMAARTDLGPKSTAYCYGYNLGMDAGREDWNFDYDSDEDR